MRSYESDLKPLRFGQPQLLATATIQQITLFSSCSSRFFSPHQNQVEAAESGVWPGDAGGRPELLRPAEDRPYPAFFLPAFRRYVEHGPGGGRFVSVRGRDLSPTSTWRPAPTTLASRGVSRRERRDALELSRAVSPDWTTLGARLASEEHFVRHS